MAQLVAHLVRDQEVACSSQVTQTEKPQNSTAAFLCVMPACRDPYSASSRIHAVTGWPMLCLKTVPKVL